MTQIWTITLTDNPLQTTPVITATNGTTTVHVDTQYRQISAVDHTATCAYAVAIAVKRLGLACDCLHLDEATRDQIIDDARTALRNRTQPTAAVEPIDLTPRTVVVHSNRGWLRWDTSTNQPTNEVIAPVGSITHLDPRDCGAAHQGTYHLYAVAV